MNTRQTSLRRLVEKWLGPDSGVRARVTHFSHSRASRWRYVCVASQRASGELSIFFFRHDDGSWSVFPPQARCPTLDSARMPNSPSAPGSLALQG
ncbi:hypothetical protein CI15_32085 [Paraburkholderia monticola]|uniref:Uncharacterized protein n=1 Tax=Paraburkholderia monticola TaxID=1399968 RepID=A0A149PAZ6_9BURK|nr:hypothetical protein [Paraburkholderia monticola]KXU82205.1 hypothetical protein CI15_32085 [Paraburkholderia monticola]